MNIFDPIRKKNVAATPEEVVRQQFLQYLHTQKAVPLSLMQVEKSLKINTTQKRYDIVVCNPQGQPRLLVECKAGNVPLSNKVFEQAAGYNLALSAPYLAITNGVQTYCCRLNFETRAITFLADLPWFSELVA
ncbi:restriction endonuclease subunit R [Bacteroidia bacterium]|nr:restriction endonuclease subunit R [Bacteroidia bacterium]